MLEFSWLLGPLLLVALIAASIRILREYERGVVFMLGRFWKVKGPGLVILIPGVQQMVRVDLRTVVFDVPSQDVISRDNVSVNVNAVACFRVLDPGKAILQVVDYINATSQLTQTTLRSVLGKHELDEMLAERERRAKVIHAEGELQASDKLLAAAEVLSKCPQAMQLRYLQTLAGIAGDKTNTIVFPLPGEFLNSLIPQKT